MMTQGFSNIKYDPSPWPDAEQIFFILLYELANRQHIKLHRITRS